MRSDVQSFVRQVELTPAPDLWEEARSRIPGPLPSEPGGPRRWAAGALAIVLVIVAFGFAYQLLRPDRRPAVREPAPSIGPSPVPPLVGEPRITAEIPVPDGSFALGIAIADGSAWVGVTDGIPDHPRSLWRIDLNTNRVLAEIPVRGEPGRDHVAATDGAVWVASGGLLERIDPTRNAVVVEIEIPGSSVSAIVADETAVWVVAIVHGTDGDTGVLVRVNPTTNQVVAQIPLGDQVTGYGDQVKLGAGSVWVLGVRWIEEEDAEYGSDLIRIDPTTNEIAARIPIGGFSMVIAGDEVWVRYPADGVFDERRERWLYTRVDAATNEPSEPFELPVGGLQLVTREALWSIDYDYGGNGYVRMFRLDPETFRVEAQSEPIRSLMSHAVIDPWSRTAWVSAVRTIVRIDIS